MSPRSRRLVAGLAGAAAMIAAVTIVSRLLGFARTLVFLGAVGATPVGDAYSTANTLPNVLFEVVAGGAIAGALIPVIAGPLARGLRTDVDRIASAMLGWTLALLIPLAGALAVLAEPIAGLFVPSDAAQRDLVASFVVVFAVQIPLYGLAVVLSGILQAQRAFFWPAFAPILSSVVVIATYVVFARWVAGAGADVVDPVATLPDGALAWIAWGTTAGVAAMSLPLLLPVRRSGVRLRPTLRFPEGTARRVRHLALAGVGALVAQQLSVVVTMWLANNRAPDGTYAAYLMSVQAVYVLPYAVLAVPLATSTFPRLAARASVGDLAGYARMASVSTRAVLVASAVGAAALVAVAPAVAGVVSVFAEGDPEVLVAVGPALTWIAPGLLGMGLIFHVSRALYALERGRAAVLATSLGWLVVAVASVVACVLLVPSGTTDGPATMLGLAIGSTVGMLVAGLALLVALRGAAGAGATAGLARTLGVLVVAGTGGAVAGRWTVDSVRALVDDGMSGSLFAAAGGGVLAAAIVLAATWTADRSTFTGLVATDRTRRTSPPETVPHHEDAHG